MDLAEDALEAAETYTKPRITDDSDQVLVYNLSRLFTSPSKVWTAQRLLQSTLRTGTPNNDVNLVKGRYTLTELPYMDSSKYNYWALKDDMMNANPSMMILLESQPLQKDGPYIDFDTKGIKYSWDEMLTAGHNDWRPFLCSSGANA